MDFVGDQLYNGKRFRVPTLGLRIAPYSRECLELYANKSITGEAMSFVLDQVKQNKGLSGCIKVDNGSEFSKVH